MLLFNIISKEDKNMLENFNTSNVTIQRILMLKHCLALKDFNTSNVTIQLRDYSRNLNWELNFNTSNVTIQPCICFRCL